MSDLSAIDGSLLVVNSTPNDTSTPLKEKEQKKGTYDIDTEVLVSIVTYILHPLWRHTGLHLPEVLCRSVTENFVYGSIIFNTYMMYDQLE